MTTRCHLVALACLAGAVGCESFTPHGRSTGEAEIVAVTSSALSGADVMAVGLRITGAGIDPAMTSDLARVGTRWQGTVGGIPAGIERVFAGDARDASGATIYAGETAHVTVEKNRKALVALVLQKTRAPIPFENSAPQIDSAFASSNEVEPGGTITVRVTASDPDPGDTLSYAWSSTEGTFAAPGAAETTWTAGAEGTPTLTLRVRDARGASAAVSFVVHVRPLAGHGGASVGASFNDAPVVTAIAIDKNPLAALDVAQLGVTAADIDGDAITAWDWSSSCVGSFSDVHAAAPTFTLSALSATGSCAFDVKVTDARGGWNTGKLSVQTGMPVAVGQAPVVDQTFQAADEAGNGDSLPFRVRGHDPEGGLVTYAWQSSVGSVSAPTMTAGGESETTWTAPACFRGSALITATLTDPTGASTTEAFTVHATGAGPCAPAVARASVSTTGAEAEADSDYPALSADGRYVVFVSSATTLTSHTYSGTVTNVFRRDVVNGVTDLVSAGSLGTDAGDDNSAWPSISSDGRMVAFRSCARNLVPAPPGVPPSCEVFVKDMQTGVLTLASREEPGTSGPHIVDFASIAPDGTAVCFFTLSPFVATDTDGEWDVYRRDLVAGRTDRITPNGSSAPGTCAIRGPKTAFTTAKRLDVNDVNSLADLYVHEPATGVTLLSTNAAGLAIGVELEFAISDDATTFSVSTAESLVAGDGNSTYDLYVRRGSTWALAADGGALFGQYPTLSGDGRFLAFYGATASAPSVGQIFVRDLVLDSSSVASAYPNGAPLAGFSRRPAISHDGRFIAFRSSVSDLVPADLNSKDDIFVLAHP